MPSIQRHASSLLLEIEGRIVGPLVSARGGEPFGTVIEEPEAGPGPFPKKHLGQVGYRPLDLVFELAEHTTLFGWIGKGLAGEVQPLTGAVIELDHTQRQRARLEFLDALPLAFALPDLDAVSRDACRFTLSLQPAMTQRILGGGAQVAGPLRTRVRALVSNFRLQLGQALDTRRVIGVQAPRLTVSFEPDPMRGGAGRAVPSLSNLRCTAADDPSWWKLVDSFLVQGHNDESEELEGTLELLSPDLGKVLLSVALQHVGLVSVAAQPASGAGGTARLAAEFYVETMELALGAQAVPAAARNAAPAKAAARKRRRAG